MKGTEQSEECCDDEEKGLLHDLVSDLWSLIKRSETRDKRSETRDKR
jgi:hypothetical protein